MSLLSSVFPALKNLSNLDLSGNPIGSGGAVELIKALSQYRTPLRALTLSRVQIGEEDCANLRNFIANCELESLDVSYNELSPNGVASIIKGLQNKTITKLRLSCSHFSVDNCLSLSSYLQQSVLRELYVGFCGITAQGCVHIAAQLSHENSTLRILWMLNNEIGIEGAKAMSTMIENNTSLQELHLDGDDSLEEGIDVILLSLERNRSLKLLILPSIYERSADPRVKWW